MEGCALPTGKRPTLRICVSPSPGVLPSRHQQNQMAKRSRNLWRRLRGWPSPNSEVLRGILHSIGRWFDGGRLSSRMLQDALYKRSFQHLLPVGRPKIHAMQFLIYLHVLSSIFPQTGLPVWGSYSLERVACLGRMILTVSPGLRPQSVGSGWSHDFLHLSFICLPLVSHSGSGWWHDFPSLSPVCLSFVSHLSPTLGLVGRMISFTCLPFVFHLSPTWLPLWVVLVA